MNNKFLTIFKNSRLSFFKRGFRDSHAVCVRRVVCVCVWEREREREREKERQKNSNFCTSYQIFTKFGIDGVPQSIVNMKC